MMRIWILNIVLAAVAVSLLCADLLLDRRELLGSHCSYAQIEGKRIDVLFDGQPVVPDRIDVFPLYGVVSLLYKSYTSFFHHYPTVTIVVDEDMISLCLIEAARY